MKAAVKTLVDSIEKEIQYLLDNPEYESNQYGIIEDFVFGNFSYDFSINEQQNIYLDDWDTPSYNIEIEVKSVTVTNENNKVLTNLSNEVFNQLEDNYTNY
jgi:hypothetical protein